MVPSDSPGTVVLVRRLERLVRAEMDAIVRRHGLSTPSYETLTALAARPGLSSAELARDASLTPQTMNEIVVLLESAKLIKRVPDRNRRRILRASLTPRGRRVLARCAADVDRLETRLFTGASATALRQFRRTLMRAAERLADSSAD